MIDWLHDLGKDWGRNLRSRPNGWPKRSLTGTIEEYGSVGAAIKSHEQVIPIRDMPADILEFHRAWQVLEPRPKLILYAAYYLLGTSEAKAKALGIDRATYYRRLGHSQEIIWSVMDTQSRSQKSQIMRREDATVS